MSKNPAQQLIDFGQSLWYDNISRELLDNGEIKRMIDEWGVRGMTSNPTIFDNAISGSAIYDEQIAALKQKGLDTDQIFEELALQDIAAAADLLKPMYEESKGTDGFISIEVSPLLARETQATIDQALRLFARLERPNIMIKIPGTKEGIPAVRACLEKGLNVNITLLFSVENHVEVMNAYCDGLRARKENGEAIDGIRSVASFFVSRVDSIVDSKLDEIIAAKSSDSAVVEKAKALKGKFGIANSKLAYKAYQEIFEGAQFADLKAAGAAVQRPLWASTSTKNPEYRDTIYVEELVGPETVNTMPPNTLEAVVDHGVISERLTKDLDDAEATKAGLLELGVDINALLNHLQVEGVEKFSKSFTDLNASLEAKLATL